MNEASFGKTMKRTKYIPYFFCAFVSAALITGCETTPVKQQQEPVVKVEPSPVTPPPPPPKSAEQINAEAALKDGLELYMKGDFNGALKRFNTVGEMGVDKATQLEVLKYKAFSYCVTQRQTLCKHQFEKALSLDPGFELTTGEKGHPLWGPVFARAKKAATPK